MVMKYSETAELEDKSACAGVRADLKMCLLESECCSGVRLILIEIFYWRNKVNKDISETLSVRIKKNLDQTGFYSLSNLNKNRPMNKNICRHIVQMAYMVLVNGTTSSKMPVLFK